MELIVYYLAIILLAAFIIISKTFSPIWLLVVALSLLWPQRNQKYARLTFTVTLLIFLLYFVFHYLAILVPFIAGFGLAYVLAPLVEKLEKKRIPRLIAILIFIIPLVAIFPFVVFLMITGLIDEIQALIAKIPAAFAQLEQISSAVVLRLSEMGVDIDTNVIADTITSHISNILKGLVLTVNQIGRGIGGLVVLIYYFIIIPITTYIFLADRKRILFWFRNLFQENDRARIDRFIESLNYSLSGFFRGQLIIVVLIGTLVGFLLWVLGIKYYLLLGIIAGLGNLIPNVGFILSLIPALLVGFTSTTPVVSIIKICCVFFGEQLLENIFIGPLILGKHSRLHPVIVMIVLILGGAFMGFWGVVFAIPTTILIRETLNHFLELKL